MLSEHFEGRMAQPLGLYEAVKEHRVPQQVSIALLLIFRLQR